MTEDIVEGYTRKVVSRSYMLAPGDLELLKWGADFLGCSQSDVVRSAIRSFVTSLQNVQKNTNK